MDSSKANSEPGASFASTERPLVLAAARRGGAKTQGEAGPSRRNGTTVTMRQPGSMSTKPRAGVGGVGGMTGEVRLQEARQSPTKHSRIVFR